ncbi:MAG: ABC transporter permease [Firmicutes bacterium HGW-Firmicutes-15]|nr:MAG: ABC transporter permease [Firmicutes bacterium HGW-Firmicutes-15]
MKDYLALAPQYLAAHKKKTRLTILSVVISVALITGVFSMLDALLQFEKIQVIHDYGNYHIAVKDATDEEMQAIGGRIDVKNTGRWKTLGEANINGMTCALGALDENFTENLNIEVIQGKYPTGQNEIMLEKWAAESIQLNLKVGDTVNIAVADGTRREYTVTGIYNDLGNMKAQGIPGVFLSMDDAELMPAQQNVYLIEFKGEADMIKARQQIQTSLNIPEDRIGRNDRLLAVIGQSDYKAAVGIYQIGGILFFIVLLAGVVMIYNTFNISVMERVRHFGLLRCIGASPAQIKKIVKREGLTITLKAIPLGVLLGMIMTFVCCALLKFYNTSLFGDIQLFYISTIGIIAGIVVGFMTVFIASLLPAKKAAQVSPVNAVTGSNDIKVSKNKKRGLLTKMFPVEIALGMNNAIMKKKTLFWMSCSIAISIIMFMGFNVFVDFMHAGLKTNKPYTPDITLTSKQGISEELSARAAGIDGVKKVYGRMFGYVDATFDAARLSDAYKESMGGIEATEGGLFTPSASSWLISYEENQLNWAKDKLMAGELSEDKMNTQNGIIAVAANASNGRNANLQLGDKVYVRTPSGTKEFTVMGILNSVPFQDNKQNLTTFITTEKIFTELTGKTLYDALDIQLSSKNQEQTVAAIKGMMDSSINFLDSRQKNAEIDQTFLTMAIFIYGFVAVIALISILNIISTMNTSVASKTKYLGVMRAVGMSGKQLNKMVLIEAITYGLTGCLAGCILGVILQKQLIENLLTSFHIIWKFPVGQIVLILIFTIFVTALSVISPLKRIKAKGISEVIGAL